MTSEEKLQYLLDIKEIELLLYRYCHYNDGGWPEKPLSHQGPAWQLFTEDAVWDGGDFGVFTGREEIRKVLAGFAAVPMSYHAVMNPLIEIAGDHATGNWHKIGGITLPDGRSLIQICGYEDEYRRTAEGWRISRMVALPGLVSTLPEQWKVL